MSFLHPLHSLHVLDADATLPSGVSMLCRYVLKVQLLHNGVLSSLAEIPAAADRPTAVLKADVAAALGSSTLCGNTHAPAPVWNSCFISPLSMLACCRPAVVAARESISWEPIADRVRLRDCKGTEVGKVLQERKKLKSVRQHNTRCSRWQTAAADLLLLRTCQNSFLLFNRALL